MPFIYGHPVGTGPTVVEDEVGVPVDVESVEIEIELFRDGAGEVVDIELVVVDIELVEDEKVVRELMEESLYVLDIDKLDEDMLLVLIGSMLLVELTRTVVVVAPAAIAVKVSVSISRPLTPSYRV